MSTSSSVAMPPVQLIQDLGQRTITVSTDGSVMIEQTLAAMIVNVGSGWIIVFSEKYLSRGRKAHSRLEVPKGKAIRLQMHNEALEITFS